MGHARRGRWLATLAGLILIAGAPAVLPAPAPAATTRLAKGPTSSASKRSAYFRRIFLTDGYEKAGHHDPAWDDSARKAIELYVRRVADDPARSDDEADDALAMVNKCRAARCDSLMVIGKRLGITMELVAAALTAKVERAALIFVPPLPCFWVHRHDIFCCYMFQ